MSRRPTTPYTVVREIQPISGPTPSWEASWEAGYLHQLEHLISAAVVPTVGNVWLVVAIVVTAAFATLPKRNASAG